MSDYSEYIPETMAGILTFLESGVIKGLGKKTAALVYKKFGNDTLRIFDNEPEKLLEVKGISSKKLDTIISSYISFRGARELIVMLKPFGIGNTRCVALYKKYGAAAANKIRENPYMLAEYKGIGFPTAEAVARKLGIDLLSSTRIEAGIIHVMNEAQAGGSLFTREGSGHLCVRPEQLLDKAMLLLDCIGLTEAIVKQCANDLVVSKKLVCEGGWIYLAETAYTEKKVALELRRISRSKVTPVDHMEDWIEQAENALSTKLAPEQKEAVEAALTKPLAIITGGPGTGKTTVLNAIIWIFQKYAKNADIVCMAPTGRAARRMTEATGKNAATIHSTLGIDMETNKAANELTADMVLVDEVSMLDIYIAKALFEAVQSGTRLLLVGDADQLPSVGPGAVLNDMIMSKALTTVRLTKVFRQANVSTIAINAARIRRGNVDLEYADDFVLHEVQSDSEAADEIVRQYLAAVKEHGIDNVAILCPMRKRGEDSVNNLNRRIQDIINPQSSSKPEIIKHAIRFRLGDKVMLTKNSDKFANGDIGYITNIFTDDDGTTIIVDFGDGRVMTVPTDDMQYFDLAYACTIHKSQGSEYKVVITALSRWHFVMAKRNLIYTSITRARQQAIIIGQSNSVKTAILTEDSRKRQSLLRFRLSQ